MVWIVPSGWEGVTVIRGIKADKSGWVGAIEGEKGVSLLRGFGRMTDGWGGIGDQGTAKAKYRGLAAALFTMGP
jgi:hypothetical protein